MRVQRDELLELLGPLTEWLLRSSFEGTMRCEATVRRIADRYGHRAEATFLADAVLLTVGGQTLSYSREAGVPPLDQVSRVHGLIADIDRGELSPSEAKTRLDEILAMPVRWSRPWRIIGLVAFSVGFGVSVQATWQQVAVSAFTGLLVGIIVVFGAPHRRLAFVTPFLASVVVSAVVLVLYEHGLVDGGPIQLLVPALFYFIPGDAISAAALELSTNRLTAGAARLVYSVTVLLVLAFGALLATVVLRVPQRDLFDVDVPGTLGPLWTWLGWALFAVGVMLVFSMGPRDFPWALGLILLTAAVTEIGVRAFGDPVGTFVGATVMTATALLVSRRPGRPPAYVIYLGAFYVLTPGSHGLRGLESWIGGHPIQGVTGVADMVGLMVAITVGMLMGAAMVGSGRLVNSGQ